MPFSMLLFIMIIKQLTRKILALTKLRRISLGKASLKGSHFTDNLNLLITHSPFFSTHLEILNHFFLFSDLKINHDKTIIIFNLYERRTGFQFAQCLSLGLHLIVDKQRVSSEKDVYFDNISLQNQQNMP